MINFSRRSFLRNFSVLGSSLWCSSQSVFAASQKLKNTLNIKTLGAIGDGKTDDSNAINKALSLVVLNGGELYFPDGVYLITRPLSYKLSKDVTLSGQNAQLKFCGNFGGNYALQFQGNKNFLQSLGTDLRAGSSLIKLNTPRLKNVILLLEENNYRFMPLNLSLSQANRFAFILSTEEEFFTLNMQGKNLINNKDSATFLILEVQNAHNAIVVPGNNQPININLSDYTQWAIADLWCSSRSYYYKGEFVAGKQIKNNYLCDVPILDNYTHGFTVVSQVSSGKLTIRGLNFKGAHQALFGLNLLNQVALTIDSVSISEFLVNSLLIKESFNINICKLTVDVAITNQQSNYATCFDSSQMINLSESTFTGGFHALSHGGTFPCRKLNLSQLTLSGSKNWALDFHGNSQDIIINNVISKNGAYIGGIDAQVTNSIFSNDSNTQGALVLAPERNSHIYQVTNCKITNLSGNAMVLANQFVINRIDNVEFSTNLITAGINGILLQAYPYGVNPYLQNLNIRENKLNAPTKFKNINNHNKLIILQQSNQFL